MKTIAQKFLLLIAASVLLTATHSLAKAPDQKHKKNTPADNTTQLQKKLKNSDIASLTKPDSTGTKDNLAELIAQIEALDIPDTKTKTAPQPQGRPSTAHIQHEKTDNTKPAPAKKTAAAVEPSTKKTKDIGELIDNSENIIDPLAVAESLFVCNKLDKAAKYYDLALLVTNEADPSSDTNRAWILFQLANCLRSSEPVRASKLYQQLITEYPESSWTPVASIQKKIVDWSLQAQPKTVLEKHQGDPNSL